MVCSDFNTSQKEILLREMETKRQKHKIHNSRLMSAVPCRIHPLRICAMSNASSLHKKENIAVISFS